MILDIEGASGHRAISSRLRPMLSIASAAVAAAALLAIAALPHGSTPRFAEPGPSILEQAFAKPKPPPTLDLALPSEIAVEVQPPTIRQTPASVGSSEIPSNHS